MLTAKLILERFDRMGRLLEKREQPSRSFTLGFLELLYLSHAQIAAGTPYTMTDIDGNPRDIDDGGWSSVEERKSKANLMIGAPPGNSQVLCMNGYSASPKMNMDCIEGQKIGIQAGTGNAAVTPTDTALTTRIAHGGSAGELEYGGCELVGLTFADPDGEFTIRRYFTNNSGGAITVEEVGIHAVGCDQDTASYSFLIAHDLTGGVAVADTELLRVTYVVQITV